MRWGWENVRIFVKIWGNHPLTPSCSLFFTSQSKMYSPKTTTTAELCTISSPSHQQHGLNQTDVCSNGDKQILSEQSYIHAKQQCNNGGKKGFHVAYSATCCLKTQNSKKTDHIIKVTTTTGQEHLMFVFHIHTHTYSGVHTSLCKHTCFVLIKLNWNVQH